MIWIVGIACLFVGAMLGFLLAAILCAGHDSDERWRQNDQA